MDNTSITSVSYSERLARMEEKILMLDTKIDTLISQLNKYTEATERRLSALEKWRGWMTGVVLGVSGVLGALLALVKVGFLHF